MQVIARPNARHEERGTLPNLAMSRKDRHEEQAIDGHLRLQRLL
jgi:hypothetical protein